MQGQQILAIKHIWQRISDFHLFSKAEQNEWVKLDLTSLTKLTDQLFSQSDSEFPRVSLWFRQKEDYSLKFGTSYVSPPPPTSPWINGSSVRLKKIEFKMFF